MTTRGMTTDGDWNRLSPRMLLVHPVHEVLRQIPVIIGSVVLGSATGNPMVAFAVVALTVGIGIARWFTTTYRIGPGDLQLRTGILQRKVLSLPRNRIRSVSTDARLLHRLLGLTVLRVSTGQEAKGDDAFALDAVQAEQAPRLRAILLADSLAPDVDQAATPGRVLARWQPSWLRYSPLSFTGLAMIAAAVGVAYQVGAGAALRDSRIEQSSVAVAERFGVAATVAAAAAVVLLASVMLSVAQSLLSYGNLELRRDADVLHLKHGLLRVREHTFDMRRLRGGTLREPLLVRLFRRCPVGCGDDGCRRRGRSVDVVAALPEVDGRVGARRTDRASRRGGRTAAQARARGDPQALDPRACDSRCRGGGAGHRRRCRSGRGRHGRCSRRAVRCWPSTGHGRSDIAWVTAGWSRGPEACNAGVTASQRPASSAGRCARR